VDKVVPHGERRNKTPVYVSEVKNTRKFLDGIRATSESKLVSQMKGEILMLVPETADGFRATIAALRSLDTSEGVSFHTFSLPEDRCVCLLLKNFGTQWPKTRFERS
jgi:excinuclease UvrABC nuclease subunit